MNSHERGRSQPLVGLDYLSSQQKRRFDRACVALVAPLALPVLGIAKQAVRLIDGPPTTYECRVANSETSEFDMLKIRTMVDGPDRHIGEKRENDPRITPTGKVLRKFSFDEFPQLQNVWEGTMSFVGIRPVFLSTMKQYSVIDELKDLYPRWADYYGRVKKGCISPMLLAGRATTTQIPHGVRRMMRADIHYVEHATLVGDMVMILKGIIAAGSLKGAY